MPAKQNDSLIVSLAEKFSQKQVDTQIVTESLALICDSFSFDCGFVYGVDASLNFYLKERYMRQEVQPCYYFLKNTISPDYRDFLAGEAIVILERGPQSTPDELGLLDLFQVQSLILISGVDNCQSLFGMIVLANITKQIELSAADKKTISIVASLFMQYVGVRIYINKLSFSQTALESVLDNTGIDIYVNDFHTHEVLYVNKTMAAPYGGKSQFMNKKCWQVLFPGQSGPCEFCPQNNLLDSNGDPSKVYTWDYQRPFDGRWFRVFSAAFRWVDGRLAHVVSSADITDNKRNEEMIQYLAHYDALTRLPNRRMLINECEHRIAKAQQSGNMEKGFLLFFDIDGFKAINDNFGHDTGDDFLIQLGEFFSDIPLLKGNIYRHGGDEFVALLDGHISESNIRSLANFIHARFKKPWTLNKGAVYCNTSIGVARCPEDGTTADELLHKADQAMYQIKKCGGAGIHFSSVAVSEAEAVV